MEIFEGAYGPNPDYLELNYDDGSFSGSDFASEDVTIVEEKAEAGFIDCLLYTSPSPRDS